MYRGEIYSCENRKYILLFSNIMFVLYYVLSSIKLLLIPLLWATSCTAKMGLTAIQTHLISCTQGEICLLNTCWECSPSVWPSSFKSQANMKTHVKHSIFYFYCFLKYLSVALFFFFFFFFFTPDIFSCGSEMLCFQVAFLKKVNKQANK